MTGLVAHFPLPDFQEKNLILPHYHLKMAPSLSPGAGLWTKYPGSAIYQLPVTWGHET